MSVLADISCVALSPGNLYLPGLTWIPIMQAIEYTIQRLIGSGMDPKTENNPYLGFIYTSFQERATKVRRSLATDAINACKHACRGMLLCKSQRLLHTLRVQSLSVKILPGPGPGTVVDLFGMVYWEDLRQAYWWVAGEPREHGGARSAARRQGAGEDLRGNCGRRGAA